MDIVKEYFELRKKVHEHFGYVEDWVNIPLDDHTMYHWMIMEDKNDEDATYAADIVYHEEPLKDGYEEVGNHYEATLYTQRFLPKWIYRADDYTMICMDTHCDGNRFIGVFDNKKEQFEVNPY